MARVQGNELVLDPQGRLLVKVDGASVTITQADGVTPATVYAAATGGTTVAQPLTTENGLVVAPGGGEWWLEPGVYVRKATHADGRVLDPRQIDGYSGVDAGRLTAVEDKFSGADPSSAVLTTAAPFVTGRYRLRDRWAAGDFGAKFNGDDETAELQDAIHETRTAGRVLWLPEGVSAASAEVTDSGDNALPLAIRGAGSGLTVIEHGIASAPLLNLAGSLASGINEALLAPAAQGATAISIVSTAGIATNDIVYLTDVTQGIDGDSAKVTNALVGEYVRVRSNDSPTGLTLRGPLANSYTTSATLHKLNPAQGVTVADLTIQNPTPGTAGILSRALVVTKATRVRVLNVHFKDMDSSSIYLQFVYGFEVGGCEFENAQDQASANAPYDVFAGSGTNHGIMHDCQGRYGRHMFTTGADVAQPSPQFIRVSDCIATEYNETAFDTHPGSRWVTFSDCQAHHGLSSGFKLRGPDQRVIGCEVNGGTEGVVVIYGADRARIEDVVVRNVDNQGVLVQSSDDVHVLSSRLEGRTHGVEVKADATWSSHMTKFAIDDVDVDGNPSIAAVAFTKWNDNFRVGKVRAPSATTRFSGGVTDERLGITTVGLPGVITPQVLVGTPTSTAATANRGYASRVYLEDDFTISAIGFLVSALSATNDNCDVWILDAAGTKLAASAATAGKLNAATGRQSIPLAFTFRARTVYYMGFSYGASAAPGSLTMATFSGANSEAYLPFGPLPPDAVAGIKAAVHPFSGQTGITSFAAGAVPILLGIK